MRTILLFLIFSAILMGCVGEKPQKNVTTPTTPTETVELPINESEINETLSYLEEIENIDFNLTG